MAGSAAKHYTPRRESDRQSPEIGERAPSLGMLENAIGFHLRLAHDAASEDMANRVGGGDLRAGWFATLLLIDENPNINQTTLSQASGRDKSTTSLLLRDLEKQGLVARTRSEVDRRTAVLNLTAAGRAQLKQLKVAARAHEVRLSAVLGDRQDEFLVTLKLLAEALTDSEH